MTRFEPSPPISAAFVKPRFGSWVQRITARLVLTTALGLVLGSFFFAAQAQTPTVGRNEVTSEERLKVVYLYKFINYVEWPDASFAKADSPYVIGIVNADEIANELVKLSAERAVNNRLVTVKKLQFGDQLNGIHVLFIGKGERAKQTHMLKTVAQQPVLVVTETEGALAQGSMINFRLVDDRVRFEVALDLVEKSGLKLSSRIVGVALSIQKGTQQ